MEHKLSNQNAIDYILAGKAIFTTQNTETTNRFTYKVKKHKTIKDLFFVSVLSSPGIYTYIGSIIRNQFQLTKGSKVSFQAQSFLVFSYIFSKLNSNTLPKKIDIIHHNRCGRCGDILTVPESISRGLGPICMKLIDKQKS